MTKRRSDQPVRAIVLAGGGARGAYEVGVLSYIFQELPKKLLDSAKLQIMSGTSVGALHACYLAGTAHIPGHDLDKLLDVWRDMRIEKMLRVGALDVARWPMEIRKLFDRKRHREGLFVNARKFEEIVVRDLPWAQLRYNLRTGLVDAVTVSATHIASGKSTVFVDSHDRTVPRWTRDRRIISRATQLGPEHALASSAMPFLFPARMVDGSYYCDGGVRLNTPLSPALRLGADRVLVVGLRSADSPEDITEEHDEGVEEAYPGPMFLSGKLVDSIMLDRLDYDIQRLNGFNMLLHDGRKAFGDKFEDAMSETAMRMRGAKYREVEPVVITPSRDLGEMASEFVDVFRSKMGGIAGFVFGRISSVDMLGGSDLLSYILFDGRMAEALIELGKADADAARSSLIGFFSD